MTDPVTDLVAYLAGDAGAAGDRCRRALADPASDLSQFLTAARERTRAAVAEPAFRGLGLSPAACLPPDLPADAEESPPQQKTDRRWVPWMVAVVALLLAGLSAWAPWRAGMAAPAGGADAVPANQTSRGEGRPGPVLPADPVAARRSEPAAVAVRPSGPPMPRLVPEVSTTGPAPAAGSAAKVAEPVAPRPALPTGERTGAVEELAKGLRESQDQAAALERKNAELQRQVTTLTQAVAQGRADCDRRAAGLQKTIDALRPTAAEAVKLRDEVRDLRAKYEALLKARPPIDPVKPPVDVKKKP